MERQVRLPRQDGRRLPHRGPAGVRPPPSCRGSAASRRPLPLVLGPGGCERRPGARALGSDGRRRKWSVETEAWRVSGPQGPRGARSDPGPGPGLFIWSLPGPAGAPDTLAEPLVRQRRGEPPSGPTWAAGRLALTGSCAGTALPPERRYRSKFQNRLSPSAGPSRRPDAPWLDPLALGRAGVWAV